MTFTQYAKSKAPSYYYLPNDGVFFKCLICNKKYPHFQMIKQFTPDNISHLAICVFCVDDNWIADATQLNYKEGFVDESGNTSIQ